MSIFRNYAIGLILGAGALIVTTASEAMPLAPLKIATPVTQVAQGCGPGGYRGPYGHCRYGGYYGRRCWRGPYGAVHCAY
jgi:hypothetical protein